MALVKMDRANRVQGLFTIAPPPSTRTWKPMRPLGAADLGNAKEKSVATSPASTGSGSSAGGVARPVSEANDTSIAPRVGA